jgi:hypothetical protein
VRQIADVCSVEVHERLNRNYPSKAPDCRGDIRRADRYVEYLGDAGAYESGERYCLPCGITTRTARDVAQDTPRPADVEVSR